MNYSPPSDRTLEFRSLPRREFTRRRRVCGGPPPISAKRTQFPPHPPSADPKNSKRTQFTAPQPSRQLPHPVFYETNPISPRPTTQLRETNPIYEPPTTNYEPKKCETNPIYRIATILPAEPSRIMRNEANSRPPNYAKRTQFTAPYTICNIQYTILWPNLPLPQSGPRSKYPKRTQFPYGHGPGAPGCPHYAKQTQSAASPPSCQPIHPELYETNPIRVPTASRRPLFQRNEPNFACPNLRPISTLPRCPQVSPDLSGNPICPMHSIRRPKNAKRTQSPHGN